jgi:hypothetical protein
MYNEEIIQNNHTKMKDGIRYCSTLFKGIFQAYITKLIMLDELDTDVMS